MLPAASIAAQALAAARERDHVQGAEVCRRDAVAEARLLAGLVGDRGDADSVGNGVVEQPAQLGCERLGFAAQIKPAKLPTISLRPPTATHASRAFGTIGAMASPSRTQGLAGMRDQSPDRNAGRNRIHWGDGWLRVSPW